VGAGLGRAVGHQAVRKPIPGLPPATGLAALPAVRHYGRGRLRHPHLPLLERCSLSQWPAAAVPRRLQDADTAFESRAGGHAFGPGPGCHSVLADAGAVRVWPALSGDQCLAGELHLAAAHGHQHSPFQRRRLDLGQRSSTIGGSSLWALTKPAAPRHRFDSPVPSHQPPHSALQRLAGHRPAAAALCRSGAPRPHPHPPGAVAGGLPVCGGAPGRTRRRILFSVSGRASSSGLRVPDQKRAELTLSE